MENRIQNNESVMKGIKNSWTLMAFAKAHGKMSVAPCVSKDGNAFKSCVFTNDEGTKCFVGFSSKMGELTPAQIVAKKNDLQVIQLESDTFKLCEQGTGSWEDVDLGL